VKRYRLTVDNEACWGCKACEVACSREHDPPNGIKLISVSEDGPATTREGLQFLFQVNLCRHCNVPPCADICTAGAIKKRDDGIVLIDETRCFGCEACVYACPYNSIAFDSANRVARKCTLCLHRIDQGLIPACADNVCLAHCIHFRETEEDEEL
jgi:tetrathionate reductase subunit B